MIATPDGIIADGIHIQAGATSPWDGIRAGITITADGITAIGVGITTTGIMIVGDGITARTIGITTGRGIITTVGTTMTTEIMTAGIITKEAMILGDGTEITLNGPLADSKRKSY
jgi:hypothetical protein